MDCKSNVRPSSALIRSPEKKGSSHTSNMLDFRWCALTVMMIISLAQLLASNNDLSLSSLCSMDSYHLTLPTTMTMTTMSNTRAEREARWMEQMTGGPFAISCPEAFAKVASGQWVDPNDGKLLYRKLKSEPHFLMSVHHQAYDAIRYRWIYIKGEYYETKVRRRFEYILNETIMQSNDYDRNDDDFNSDVSSLPLVLDIGGNIGFYTFLSAAWKHAVVTFEINPSNILRICESLHLNTPAPHIGVNPSTHTMHVQVYQIGLSNVTGDTFEVSVPLNPGAAVLFNQSAVTSRATTETIHSPNATERLFSVTTMTLDDFAQNHGWFTTGSNATGTAYFHPSTILHPPPHISLVKIDTEGHELQILRGAQTFFKEHLAHNVLVEYRFHCWDAVRQTLLDQDYVMVVEDDDDDARWLQLNSTESQTYLRALTEKMRRRPKMIGFVDLWFRWKELPPVQSVS